MGGLSFIAPDATIVDTERRQYIARYAKGARTENAKTIAPSATGVHIRNARTNVSFANVYGTSVPWLVNSYRSFKIQKNETRLTQTHVSGIDIRMDHRSIIATAALCVATAHGRESAEHAEIKRLQLKVKELDKKNKILLYDLYESKMILEHHICCMNDQGLEIEQVSTPRDSREYFVGRVTRRDER